jgi:glucokinase
MNTLAVDIGGTKFTLAIFDGDRMIERQSFSTDRAGGRDWMLERIQAIVTDWKTRHAIHCCGIGFGGPVDFASQRVALSTHVPGWNNFDLPRFLEQCAGVPPVIDNDANAGALGEALHGAGRGYRPLFYMTLSTGIGGGIIRTYHGARRRTRVSLRIARLLGTFMLRPVARA